MHVRPVDAVVRGGPRGAAVPRIQEGVVSLAGVDVAHVVLHLSTLLVLPAFVVAYAAGRALFGTWAGGVAVLALGSVALSLDDQPLFRLTKGECFGEMEALDGGTRIAAARASGRRVERWRRRRERALHPPARKPAPHRRHRSTFKANSRFEDMAEQEGANGASEPQSAGGDILPQVGVIAQYVKDLSFENPNAPAVYQWQSQPQMDVQFNIGAGNVGQDVHEVTLKIDITAKAEEGTAFKVELLYAGLFALKNIPSEQMQPFLLAEAPRLLFPFARRIISETTVDAGFPPLLLDPIDFAGLYMQRAAQQQAEETGGQAGDVTGQA